MAVIDLVLRGVLLGSQTWSTHVNCTQFGSGAVGQTDLDTWLATAKGALDTFWSAANSVGAQNDPTVKYSQLQAYYRLGPGGTPQLISGLTVAKAGTSASSNAWPWQSCMCVTLTNGFPGRRERGRMFLPCTQPVGVTGVHQFNATATSGTATALAAALHIIANAPLGGNLAFPQPVNSTKLYTTVKIDNRVDIQRRRVDKLPASSFSVATI